MKVLLVVGDLTKTGGIENLSKDILNGIKSLGFKVEILSMRDHRNRTVNDCKSYGKSFKNKLIKKIHTRFLTTFSVINFLKNKKYDLIIVTHLFLLEDVQKALALNNGAAKTQLWLHGREAWGNYVKKFTDQLKLVDQIVCVSSFTKAQIMTRVKDLHSIKVINPTVNTGYFKPDSEFRNYQEILYVGRLNKDVRYKGLDKLLYSISEICKEFKQVKLNVIGNGNDKEYYHELVEKLSIEDHVNFYGSVSREQLKKAYQANGVFILPSRVEKSQNKMWKGEGFGIVYIEAQACGTPVICGNYGGSIDTILHKKTGIMINPNNVEEITKAICYLLNNKDQQKKMGILAREFVESNFSNIHFNDKLSNCVNELFSK